MTTTAPTAEETGNPSSPRAKIVMMVGNDIAHDTRVLKMGLTMADAGLDVTLLGYASSGKREETMLGDVRILRVPVKWKLRDAATIAKAKRRARHLRVARPQAKRRTRDLRAKVLRREHKSVGGLKLTFRKKFLRVEQHVTQVRSAADERILAAERTLWRAYDRGTNRIALGASWRSRLPEIDDYELAFGPALDKLEWDVLHAHDVHLVGVASRAVARRRASGRSASWVYDAHEYVAGLSLYESRTVRKRAAYLDLESEYARDADAIVTVTPPLADRLRKQYRLTTTPSVVMNSPILEAAAEDVDVTIRQDIGLAADIPLVVYSGGLTPVRGIDTALEALVSLPEVHLAVVVVPHREIGSATQLTELAASLGVGDRLHLVNPVPPDEVSAYLASADIGVIPLHHYGSHEVALANKLFEYLHGGLPVLVSDCEAQAAFVREHEVGGVHIAEDTASYVEELRAMLTRLPELQRRIAQDRTLLEPYAWERQEAVLRDLYRGLLGAERISEPDVASSLEELHEVPKTLTNGG